MVWITKCNPIYFIINSNFIIILLFQMNCSSNEQNMYKMQYYIHITRLHALTVVVCSFSTTNRHHWHRQALCGVYLVFSIISLLNIE